MSMRPACTVCRNWESNCICPMENCFAQEPQGGPVRVVAAAVMFGNHGYAVKPPARHHNVLHMARDQFNEHTEVEHRQGFLLSDGRFVGRRLATKFAKEARQPLLRGDRDGDWPLTSEDLW